MKSSAAIEDFCYARSLLASDAKRVDHTDLQKFRGEIFRHGLSSGTLYI